MQHVELPTYLVLRVLEHLPPNEFACTARLVCKETARWFHAQQHRAVSLSHPLPPHAAEHWRRWQDGLAQLSFKRTLGVLCTAAASGCETNVDVAWRLVAPCLFAELPPQHYAICADTGFMDCGVAAATAGHAHLLPWLVAHRCPLHPQRTLEAVARHCDLRALQAAWELLRAVDSSLRLTRYTCGAAARSDADALAKVDWVLAQGGPRVVDECVSASAASKGALDRLQHLRGLGFPIADPDVLQYALARGRFEVAVWLVEQGGCELPLPPANVEAFSQAVGVGGSVEAAAWVREQGVVLAPIALLAAAKHERLEAVRYLVEECGMAPDAAAFEAAAGSGSIATAAYLMRGGAPVRPEAFEAAAASGSLAMVAWLLREARCPLPASLHALIARWPAASSAHSADLLAAVRLLLEAGYGALGPLDLDAACRHGALLLVRLLRGAGCGYSPDAVAAAARGGSAAVLEWMAADGCPLGDPGKAHVAAFVAAARLGNRGALCVLRALGVPACPSVLVQGLFSGCPVRVLRWMVEEGCVPVDAATLREAVGRTRAHVGDPTGAWLLGLLERLQS